MQNILNILKYIRTHTQTQIHTMAIRDKLKMPQILTEITGACSLRTQHMHYTYIHTYIVETIKPMFWSIFTQDNPLQSP